MIDEAKLAELEAAARAATSGEWRWQPYGKDAATLYQVPLTPNVHECNILKTTEDWYPSEDDAAYIAAMSPDMALSLIASLRECREQLAAERAAGRRTKREGQSFMEWLDERVEAYPEAKAAYEDEMRKLRPAAEGHDTPAVVPQGLPTVAKQTEREAE